MCEGVPFADFRTGEGGRPRGALETRELHRLRALRRGLPDGVCGTCGISARQGASGRLCGHAHTCSGRTADGCAALEPGALAAPRAAGDARPDRCGRRPRSDGHQCPAVGLYARDRPYAAAPYERIYARRVRQTRGSPFPPARAPVAEPFAARCLPLCPRFPENAPRICRGQRPHPAGCDGRVADPCAEGEPFRRRRCQPRLPKRFADGRGARGEPDIYGLRADRRAAGQEKGLCRMLELGGRHICAVMALGMPQFRYPNYIDRTPSPLERR